MNFSRVKITTTVPLENADAVRDALGKAGAGIVGNYSYCSFSTLGKGRFMPNDQANPHIGQANKLEVVEEEQIEITCDRAIAKKVIVTLKDAHPYEDVIIEVVPLLDEEDL
jgi:hypothetical protein